MDERKRNTRKFYDFISDTYDDRNTLLGLSARLAEVLVREAHIHEGARVLDVGTGTGNVALAAARAVGQRGRVVGVDLSLGMLTQARGKIGNLSVEFREMDAEALQFVDATFNVVLSGLTLWFLPDMVRGMQEIHRVLQPGGQVAFSTFTRETFQPLGEMTWARLKQYGIPHPQAPREPWMVLREPDHLFTLLEKAGFDERRVVLEASTHVLRSSEDWWTFIRRSASWSEALSHLSPESLERFRVELLEDVEKLRADAGIRVDTSALIGLGVRS